MRRHSSDLPSATPAQQTAARARILLIDDEPAETQRLLAQLAGPCEIESCPRGTAEERLGRLPSPEIVLLAWSVDGPGPADPLLATSLARCPESPVIILAATTTSESEEVHAFSAGAVDFVTRPVHGPRLIARIRTHLRLAANTRALRDLASLDPLTLVRNRRVFDTTLDREWRRATRHKTPISLVLVDLDYFKEYNDHYGHVAGDALLVTFARSLAGLYRRAEDCVCRVGGDEFAVVLPCTCAEQVAEETARIGAAIDALAIAHPGSPSGLFSVCVGCATLVPDGTTARDLFELADRALYRAKAAGRRGRGRRAATASAPPAVPSTPLTALRLVG